MSREHAERIARVREMESYLDDVSDAIKDLSEALTRYMDVREKYYKLRDYYDGGLWMQDFEADEAGKIPKLLKRGVLSEDELFDLITEHEHLLERLERASIDESPADIL